MSRVPLIELREYEKKFADEHEVLTLDEKYWHNKRITI